MEEIKVPLLNANEPEARVVNIFVKESQLIKRGEKILTLETTKATIDIESTRSGFIHLNVKNDDIVLVEDIIGWITDKIDTRIPERIKEESFQKKDEIRITDPARKLALELQIDINNIPSSDLITSSTIHEIAQKNQKIKLPEISEKEKAIVIYGGGGHAKAVIEMISSLEKFKIIGIIDDNILIGDMVLGIPVLGNRTTLEKLYEAGVIYAANSVGGIVDINIRIKICKLLEESGFKLPVIIHQKATIEKSAHLNHGVQIFANAYIGSEAVIGKNSIINTNAVVSHDCAIGAHSHIAPGCLLAGLVHIGNACLIGMGVTTAIGVNIGDRCRIGNGAIIYADVPDNTIIQGGKVWTGN